jgi:hypothetical protein
MLDTLKSIESDVSPNPLPQSSQSSFARHVRLVVQRISRWPMRAKSDLGKVSDPSGARFDGTRCVATHELRIVPTRSPPHRIRALRSRGSWIPTIDGLRSPIAERDKTPDGLHDGS